MLNSKMLYDTISEQAENDAAFFSSFTEKTKDRLASDQSLQKTTKGLFADFVLYQKAKECTLYYLDASIANQILHSETENPSFAEFKKFKTENNKVFIEFSEAIPIPDAWKNPEKPADYFDFIKAIQIVWNTKEEIQDLLQTNEIPLILSEENCTIGIWSCLGGEDIKNLDISSLAGFYPSHKMRMIIANQTRNVIFTEKVVEGAEWDETSILPTIYRFLSFVSSENVKYKNQKRKIASDKKLPLYARKERKSALVPFLEETPELEGNSIIPNANPKEASVVKASSVKRGDSRFWIPQYYKDSKELTDESKKLLK